MYRYFTGTNLFNQRLASLSSKLFPSLPRHAGRLYVPTLHLVYKVECGQSDIYHFQAWPIKTPVHNPSCPGFLPANRKGDDSQGNLGSHTVIWKEPGSRNYLEENCPTRNICIRLFCEWEISFFVLSYWYFGGFTSYGSYYYQNSLKYLKILKDLYTTPFVPSPPPPFSISFLPSLPPSLLPWD